MEETTQSPTYQHLATVAMIYAVTLLLASCLTHKFFFVMGHMVCAGSFIMPFWFVISDIITEVYGYRIARRLMWVLMISDFFFYSILQLFSLIQPSMPHSGPAYAYVFGSMLRVYFSVWVCLFFANFLNTYIISRTKIILRSRYFWLRSLGASGIGEGLYTIIGFVLILGGVVSWKHLTWLIIWGVILKVAITSIAAIPASYIAKKLIKIEGNNPYDLGINFNPFRLDIK